MIGIYKITNKINGNFYIGQSVDVKRRIMEHKTPKANGNDRLHNDMKKFGVNNFELEVLEECKKEELKSKELHYIKTLEPFYNTVGKKVPEKTRRKISESTKKWWDSLDDSEKQKIINNNLKGPKKGHAVSGETRKKISKKISEVQGIKVMIVETGEVFDKIKLCEEYLGAYKGTVYAYWKGKIKSVKGYHVVRV